MGSRGTFVNLIFKFMKVALTPLEQEQNKELTTKNKKEKIIGNDKK